MVRKYLPSSNSANVYLADRSAESGDTRHWTRLLGGSEIKRPGVAGDSHGQNEAIR